jgi:acetylornithine deacetylase/succinyl-diaminopimelate desuccinylase family protein
MDKEKNESGKKRCSAEQVSNLLVSLIKARSHPGIPRQEEEVARELKAYFQAHGIQPEIQEVKDGRPNVLATLDSRQAGPHLVFCGHTDTVPPNVGSSVDLFAAVEKEGKLYGRGTVDMKGAIAAMAGALTALKSSGELKRGKITLAAVVDEEMESLGAEFLILNGFRADAAIIGEPTGNKIAIGHKGLEWLSIEFEGRAAHGGTPQAGINAISAAGHFIRLVEEELVQEFQKRRDPILGFPVINLGTISGGDQPSTVAARCTIKLDRRWVTTETIDLLFEDLEGLLRKVRTSRPGLKTKISRVPGGMATMIHGPVSINPEHPVVKAAQRARADFGQAVADLTVFPAWTDASLLSREGKIPSIIWGPGELDQAHSPEEYIKLDDVSLAAELYAAAALHFTGSL